MITPIILQSIRAMILHGRGIGVRPTEMKIEDRAWIDLIKEGMLQRCQWGPYPDSEPIAAFTIEGVRVLPTTTGLAYDPVKGLRVSPGAPRRPRKKKHAGIYDL